MKLNPSPSETPLDSAGSRSAPELRRARASRSPVVVSARGSARIRNGHVWVYRSDVTGTEGLAPGALTPVKDTAGKLLGTALYSSASQIALRMWSDRLVDAPQFTPLLRERIAAAITLRRSLVKDSDAYRVVFSEADFLPGLIVDRYGDLLCLQVLTQAMDQAGVRAALTAILREELQPAAIVELLDARIRELEQLPPRETGLLYGERSGTVFTMNGVRFQYDAAAGQKTGAFLDQRENYAAAARYARGAALDVFCYQGGFALHLASCEPILGVDSSRAALEVAEQNAALNGKQIQWMEANAFDLLKDYASAGRQYDTIVLDPPAFAKSRRSLETALRGYKELNLRALKMLRPGGTLVTCSCSYHVSESEFLQVVAAAAVDARRRVRLLEIRTQASDHPILLTVPETRYLKCVIARAD